VFETHGDAKLREVVGEVGGAVERVDVPAVFSLHAVASSFFAIDAVIGKCFGEALANQLFGGAVGDGDQVDVAFVLGDYALREKFAQAGACFASNG